MELITLALSKVASGIGPFFLLLGLLIFVHEMGHFLVAIYFGVRVETFSLGFGKKIFSFKRGETTYCLSIIPLGGYVKMYGDDPSAEIPEDQKKYSFLHKPVWPRIAIVLAGPLMNLFFAILVFAIVGMLGEQVPSAQLGDIDAKSPAYAAGFRSGDEIKKINDADIVQWSEAKELIENSAGKNISITVKREGSEASETLSALPELAKNSFLFSTKRQVGQIDGLSTESISAMIGVPKSDSVAAIAGLQTFDIIESINGVEISFWRQLEPQLLKAKTSSTGEALLTVRKFEQSESRPPTRELRLSLSTVDPALPILEQIGIARTDLFLLSVREKSPAAAAGLQAGDVVTQLDGQPVSNWQTILDRVKSFKVSEKSIAFTVLRNGKENTYNIAPEQVDLPTEQGAMESRYAIGVVPAILSAPNAPYLLQASNPFSAVIYGVHQSWVWSKLIAISLVRLVQNEVSARNIGGVITIGRVASKSFEVGAVAFLKMMAIISINLFLLNLLPIPVLDGGHLVFFTIEALKGAPISFKKLEIAQQVGLVLLLSLMLFALFNDISHLISSW